MTTRQEFEIMTKWTQSQAIKLCTLIEMLCPKFGCHVALTGGLLYKDGERKDCDILFYRIRQVEEIDMDGLWDALATVGVTKKSGFGWCYKLEFAGLPVDSFFPEEQGGDYDPEAVRQARIDAHDDLGVFRDTMP